MSESSLRVALLARAGDACDRIGEALREAGAELVLVADPLTAAEPAVREAHPQAIVVALEPAIEDALDAFDALLSDPGYLVVFEEAELAAQRAGWDAARWVRHLSAKLHRHHDVLPPGAEDEGDLHPSPGPLPERVQEVDFDEAIAAFAEQAQQLADDVPRDSGIEGVPATDSAAMFDPVAFESSGLSLADDAPQQPDGPAREWQAFDAAGAGDGLSLVDELPADAADADADDTGANDAPAPAAASTPDFDTGGLSLATDDAPVATVQATPPAPAAIEALENRISGLSLADVDSYGHGPERGAVLVDAGLGGPDAVRQLLGALPAGFPRPVLVRLHLDGGRYDKLVKQMERAAALPVALADAGAEAAPGHVYFLPPNLGVRRERGSLRFDDGDVATQLLPEALPPDDSAVLLLSGASRRLADAVAQADWSAALVAGQSPEGSYDPDAALALLERGGEVGSPVELAAALSRRWPPPDAPAPDPEELIA